MNIQQVHQFAPQIQQIARKHGISEIFLFWIGC